jgi:hypothetical protein
LYYYYLNFTDEDYEGLGGLKLATDFLTPLCGEWTMRSLGEPDMCTAMSNNLQAGIGTAPSCRKE